MCIILLYSFYDLKILYKILSKLYYTHSNYEIGDLMFAYLPGNKVSGTCCRQLR